MQCRRPRFDSWVGKICWRRDRLPTPVFLGFPGGSAGKESTCNVGDWVQSLGWEDPLEKGKATHSSITGEFHGLYSTWVAKSRTHLSSFHLSLISHQDNEQIRAPKVSSCSFIIHTSYLTRAPLPQIPKQSLIFQLLLMCLHFVELLNFT